MCRSVPSFAILPARHAADIDAVGSLFRAYERSLPIDLGYQGFAAEVATLPGRYAPPDGALLLARDGDGQPAGCAALRRLAEAACEMKRLYVAPAGRGHGLGRALAEAILQAGAAAGYREIRLDTLASMTGAQALYRSLGFTPTAPYYEMPVAGTVFLRRALP